jgi:type I restriction enzyme S subunit
MNAERLLEHYEKIADAPDAIARLRRFILDLAVRGKLVPQDSNDEPASELLKRIDTVMARRVKDGTLRDSKPMPVIEDHEVDFELAPGWQWVRMGEVIKLWNGFAFKSGDFQTAGIPVIRIGDLQGGEVTLSGAVHVSEAISRTVGAEVWIPPDALLIAMSGATTGKIAFNRTGKPLLLNQRVGRIEVFLMSANFLRFFFETIVARNLSISFGTAIPNLSAQQINETIIPLPPLAEQHRIVAKVEELMALCDRLAASRAEREAVRDRLAAASLARLNAPDPETFQADARFALDALPALTARRDQIKQLRQTILNLAVGGRLVPQDSSDEPAGESLGRLEKAGGNAKLRRTVPEEVAIPSELLSDQLPDGWCLASVARLLRTGAISDLKDGNHGANHPKISDFVDEGLPFITAAQVSEVGTIDYGGAYKLSGPPLEKLRVGFAQSGDVIYTHKGSVGRVALCDRDCVLSPQTTYYRPNLSVFSADFLRIVLLTDMFRDQVDAVKKQTTRDFVSIQKQYEFFLRVAPLAEQHRIVAKVDALMALCDRLEAGLASTADTRRRLLDVLLAEALAPAEVRELEAAE